MSHIQSVSVEGFWDRPRPWHCRYVYITLRICEHLLSANGDAKPCFGSLSVVFLGGAEIEKMLGRHQDGRVVPQDYLQARGVETPAGRTEWQPVQVSRLLAQKRLYLRSRSGCAISIQPRFGRIPVRATVGNARVKAGNGDAP